MNKKVNLKSLAMDLGFSISTISRVLNGRATEFRISKETINSVLKYAKEKGYAPNLIAKGLQASKTFTIGLMIPDIANPFFALIAKNIERAAFKANYSILLVDAEEDIEIERRQTKNMIGRKVDGIIAAPVGTSFSHFNTIIEQKIPLIFVDRYFKEESIPYITSNNYQGAFEATKLLIENGHQRIGLIKGDEAIVPVQERRKGYRNALEMEGMEVDDELIVGSMFSMENGFESTLQLLSLSNPPTAIFAMSNLTGLGVIQALNEKSLTIPNDISLIIFDEQPYVAFLNPPITTVKQDSEKIGEMAIDFILKKIDNNKYNFSSVILPTKIIHRASIKSISLASRSLDIPV